MSVYRKKKKKKETEIKEYNVIDLLAKFSAFCYICANFPLHVL